MPHRPPCPPPRPTPSPTPPSKACRLLRPSPPTPTTPDPTPSRCPSSSPARPSPPHGPWVHTLRFGLVSFSSSHSLCRFLTVLHMSSTWLNMLTKTLFTHIRTHASQVCTCAGLSWARESSTSSVLSSHQIFTDASISYWVNQPIKQSILSLFMSMNHSSCNYSLYNSKV